MKLRNLIAASALTAAVVAGSAPSAHAASAIVGAGSTWSQIAVDQWRADVARSQLTVNYQGVGSTSGRVLYYQDQVDFAVSEIPFQTDGGVNEVDQARRRPYAYMPIVAGGTSFMYHLDVAGQRITDLRLSPDTIAKIFTGVIRTWDDAAITADNNGRALPRLPVKVAVRSDGSGTSAQFTAFMAAKTAPIWQAFCSRAGLGSGCGATSFYPNPPGLGFSAQQFSDGVANFVQADYNNGAITYVEYGYAKERGFPAAQVKNQSGNYALPLAGSVSKALEGATFNPDNTQNLGGVYNNPHPSAYPVSSYSYMIVPTTEDGRFDADKGETLSRFANYFLCAGQQKAEQLGYAPLPRNLVENAFASIRKIPGHEAPPAITACANPAITGGAPPPPPPPPAPTPTTAATVPGGGTIPTVPGGGTTPTLPGGGPVTPGNSTGGSSTTLPGGVNPKNGGTTPGGDPTNGVDPGDVGTNNVASAGAQPAFAALVDSPPTDTPMPLAVYVLVLVVVLGVVFGPPALNLADPASVGRFVVPRPTSLKRSLLVALAVTGALAGCASDDSTSDPATTAAIAIDPPLPNGVNTILYRLEDPVALGNWQVTAHSARFAEIFETPPEGREFVVLDAEFRNGATERQELKPEALLLYSSDGKGNAPVEVAETKGIRQSVKSGASVRTDVYFTIAEGTLPGALLFNGTQVYGERVLPGLIALDPDFEPPPPDQ